ncbi:MAG: acyl-CoA dehydrogenase family protein [Gammaproteobacteria bacterium]|nr:acyl-CoA dehydrogenase family protein [Gammaproteobacteria bacterium]
MDFSFSDEQRLLQDSVQRFIQNSYSFENRRKLLATDQGFSEDNWQAFAELGWLALPFPESVGGFGGTAIETMILMEEFGKGLVVEPYLSSITLAGYCLAEGGSSAHHEGPLAELMAGTQKASLAFVEPGARFDLANVTTTASGDGPFTIDGVKGVVLGGPTADWLVVPARTAGEQTAREGITVFIVDATQAGVSKRDYRTIDGHQASEITFDGVEVGADAVLGEPGKGLALLERAVGQGILAVGAEAVGAMEVMYKTTVEYCQTREQFGQPIGKFQVLQHRMVDMFMEHEQTKSLLYMAAMKLDEGDAAEADRALSALKVRVGKGGRFVGQSAIQLHGGMGMTEEMPVAHYFKRVTAIDTLFGNHDYHLRKYAKAA